MLMNRWPKLTLTNLVSFRTLALLGLLSLATAAPAFGQMGSSAIYSDAWYDDSNPNEIRMIGCGVTQDNSNMYGHTYWVQTNLRSPAGRTASATSNSSNAWAVNIRIETYLLWDQNDVGDYLVNSSHYYRCPYMGGYVISNGSSKGFKVGASTVVFRHTGVQDSYGRCEYRLIENCNVLCTGSGRASHYACTPYMIVIEPWFDFGLGVLCLPFISERFVPIDFPQPCTQTP